METVLKSSNVEVEHVQPVRLRNTEGRWRVIVNKVAPLYIYIYTPCTYLHTQVALYTQTVRVETCLSAGSHCRLLAPCYASTCVQIHTFHRLLAYNPCRSL